MEGLGFAGEAVADSPRGRPRSPRIPGGATHPCPQCHRDSVAARRPAGRVRVRWVRVNQAVQSYVDRIEQAVEQATTRKGDSRARYRTAVGNSRATSTASGPQGPPRVQLTPMAATRGHVAVQRKSGLSRQGVAMRQSSSRLGRAPPLTEPPFFDSGPFSGIDAVATGHARRQSPRVVPRRKAPRRKRGLVAPCLTDGLV